MMVLRDFSVRIRHVLGVYALRPPAVPAISLHSRLIICQFSASSVLPVLVRITLVSLLHASFPTALVLPVSPVPARKSTANQMWSQQAVSIRFPHVGLLLVSFILASLLPTAHTMWPLTAVKSFLLVGYLHVYLPVGLTVASIYLAIFFIKHWPAQ